MLNTRTESRKEKMQNLGKYEIPPGYKRKPNIDRILFYHTFDPSVQRDYISFLQTERELELKYRNRYTELSEKYRGSLPKDKDWALSTHLYRAINERKSSSSYEEALKDYWFLCKLKEEYYELEKLKNIKASPRILPVITRSQVSTSETSSNRAPLISKPPITTILSKSTDDGPLFGAPPTAEIPISPISRSRAKSDTTLLPKDRASENYNHYTPRKYPTENTLSRSPRQTQPNSFQIVEDKSRNSFNKTVNIGNSNIYEPWVTKRPAVKAPPIYNHEDNKSLVAQNKHLRELLQSQTEEIMSLRNLDRENQDIVHNLKERLSNCTCGDNPASVDYTSNTSCRELAQRFVNVYENEYKVAMETLTRRNRDRITEDVALYSMMEIIKRCYKLCIAVAKEQIENITCLMKDQIIQPCVTLHSNVQLKVSANDTKRLHEDAERVAKLFRRRNCTLTFTNLTDKFNEDLEKTPDYKDHLKTPEVSVFTEKCLETFWLMCNQEPPMSVEWPEQGEVFDTLTYKYFKGTGFKVNYPVWPAVLLYHKGPVLCKGFIVPI